MKRKINLEKRANSLELTCKFNTRYLLGIWQQAVIINDFDFIKRICDSLFIYSADQLNELYLDFKNDVSFNLL